MATKTKSWKLRERTSGSPDLRIDRENSIIRDCKLLGNNSQNGRIYSEQALRDAVILYEGKPVRLDHRPDENVRSVTDQIGTIRNVRLIGNQVRGDLHIFKSHPLAELIFEMAERSPETFGFSHDAAGECWDDENGIQHVSSLTHVESLDLVSKPATTRSLFEGRTTVKKPNRLKRMARRMLEAVGIKPTDADIYKIVRAGNGDTEKMADAAIALADGADPDEAPAEVEEEELSLEKYRDIISGILQDETLTDAEKLARIEAVNQTPEILPGDEETTSLEESLRRFKRDHLAVVMLNAVGVTHPSESEIQTVLRESCGLKSHMANAARAVRREHENRDVLFQIRLREAQRRETATYPKSGEFVDALDGPSMSKFQSELAVRQEMKQAELDRRLTALREQRNRPVGNYDVEHDAQFQARERTFVDSL